MKKLYTFLTFSLLISSVFAQNLSDRILFTARLDGQNNTTVSSPNAKGIANFFLSSNRDSLFVNVAVSNLSSAPALMQFQEGNAGEDGPVVLAFDTIIVQNKLNTVITDTNLSKILPQLISGELYFNVYSSDLPAAGDARGQINLERDFSFFANLDTAQEVPVSMGTAIGSANFKLDQNGDSLTVKLVTARLSSEITGIHLHKGFTGENGPVILNLTPFITGGRIDTLVAVPDSLKGTLKSLVNAGNVYVNLHTTTNPSGEIRGQAKVSTDLYFDLFASPEQLAAPQTFPANVAAAGHAYLNATFDTLRYFIVYEEDSLTGAPIVTAITTNGAPTKTLTPAEGVISGIWTATEATPLTVLSITALLTDQAGFTMNTAFNAAGELSGTFNRAMRDAYVFDLDTTQIVDTVEVSSRPLGAGMISVNTRGTNAHYMMAYDSLSGPAAFVAIHKGIAGENGEAILPISRVEGGAFGYLTSADGFTPASTAIFQSDSAYVLVGTLTNTEGEIRGNLSRNYATQSTPTAIFEQGNANFSELISYPNPANAVLNLRFTSTINGSATVELVSLEGRTLSSKSVNLNAGNNELSLITEALDQGLYLVRIVANNSAIATTFVKQ